MKTSLGSVFPSIKTPRIRRKHLRKYSWLPDVFRIKGSIIGRITGPVLTVTIWTVLLVLASQHGYEIVLTNSVVPLLSVVVGLILVFRNSSSYERFMEGRKAFAALTAAVRNLSRMIWVNVALPPTGDPPPHAVPKGKTPVTEISSVQLTARKADCLRLALGYVYSVKHYLRSEDGLDWQDLNAVLPPWFNCNTDSSPSSYAATRDSSRGPTNDGIPGRPEGTIKGDATKRVRAKRSKRQLSDATTPLMSDSHQTVDFLTAEVAMPLPLLIAHELGRMIFQFRRDGFLETVGPAGANAMAQIVHNMIDQLTAMERIANTPIPVSYSIHLKQVVTVYLFALPMTLVHELGWITVPLTTVVAFVFMGVEGIADEIEMPFGDDPSDLPLDRYCQDLKEEVLYIITNLPQGGLGAHGYDDGEGDE